MSCRPRSRWWRRRRGSCPGESSSTSGHSCARKIDGTLWCWGANGNGQLGDGTTTNQPTPVQAGVGSLGSNVAEVALGNNRAAFERLKHK